MTNRLYYTDSYRTEFSSAVTERASDGTRVYLDETAFYPTSGGQPHDIGTIGGTRVIGPFPGHLFTWHGSRTIEGLRFLRDALR